MRTRLLSLLCPLLLIGCGSSSETGAQPAPTPDAALDQAADSPPDAEPEAEPDAQPDAGPDAPDDASADADAATQDAAVDAGPPTGELLLQDGTSDRVVPHVAERADGTAFLSWYALSSGEYAVRMQRLDTTGAKLWADDGVLASAVDSSSWVMDYDLATDGEGNAILAYSNTTDFALRVQRIDEQGATGWGQGVVLTDTANGAQAFTPHIVRCSDGAMVAVWDETRAAGGDTTEHVVAQRLDGAGQPAWSSAYSVDPSGGLSPGFSQVVPGDEGSVIVVWVENGGVNYPGDAYAQRIDAQGQPVWAAKKKINGTDQLAFPMKPLLAADGQGGFYAAWTGLVGMAGFQGRIQHIGADGDAAWDPEGLVVASDTTMMQLPSAITFVESSSRLVVAWKRTNPNQDYSGLHVQAFDAQGARLWDDAGLEVVAADTTEGALAANLRSASAGTALFFAKGPVNGMEFTAHVAAIPLTTGASAAITDLSTTASSKSHPAVSGLVGGGYWLVWEDARGGHPVIYGSWWPSP